jgi:hypothetical protein
VKTYLEEIHLPFAIAMDTQLVVLRIKHCGKDLYLNKESINFNPCPIGFAFELPKARISFKVK